MIALFTDFGVAGPYIGQIKAVLHTRAPAVPVVELLCDAPAWQIQAAAHLLAALIAPFPVGTVFLCVVDPGVGTDQRDPVYYEIDGRWFVGPDNGIFELVATRGREVAAWRVDWRPPVLSQSFHGRDLFAPVAAMLALGEPVPSTPLPPNPKASTLMSEDHYAIIYVDNFGNTISGIRGSAVDDGDLIVVAGRRLGFAPTFGAVAKQQAFWYRNSMGLVEIAVNQGSAAVALGLQVGDPVGITQS